MKNLILIGILIMFSCSKMDSEKEMNKIAESYVKLVLEIGLYDANYVDAYYGPAEWKPKSAAKEKLPYTELKTKITEILEGLKNIKHEELSDSLQKRYDFLEKQFLSVATRIEILNGKKLTFDEESKGLYDAVAPHFEKEYFDRILAEIELAAPGQGTLYEKLNKFTDKFIIPEDKLSKVFDAAIAEGRKRSNSNIRLPENENFVVEYVKNQPWSAYNWYKGNSFSIIQVNTDMPIKIDRAVDLACHEGYPGHHVFNGILENKFYRKNGWPEFCVYPLFSPMSLIAEGTANYGIEVAFPADERIKFEKEVIFPTAGLDSTEVENYYKILSLIGKLSFAGNEAARDYLDGKISREDAVNYLMKYTLLTNERAEKKLKFAETYRSYIINYNLGQKMVEDCINRQSALAAKSKWQLFNELISSPITPSGLK